MQTAIIAVLVACMAIFSVLGQSTGTPVTGVGLLSALNITLAAAGYLTLPQTLGNATVVDYNPVGPVYTAVLPEKPISPSWNVKGSISATAAPGGKGVQFSIQFSNFPTSGGPFLYHIHVAPVNSSGSCASTLAHLDPFIRGEQPPCDAALPETCQVGDLSSKYGTIKSDPFTASYIDPFCSIVPGLGSFFGNRSITLHFANATRLSCASFAAVPGTLLTNATTSGPELPKFTGAGSRSTVSGVTLISAALVAILM